MFKIIRLSVLSLSILASAILYLLQAVVFPEAALTSAVLTFLVALIPIMIWYLLPIWPKPAYFWAIEAFLAGGSIATVIGMLTAFSLMNLTTKLGMEEVSASWAGAYPEELSKLLVVLVISSAYPQISRPWHFLTLGSVVGLGFSVMETIGYGIQIGIWDSSNDFEGVLGVLILRFIFSLGLHSALTGVIAWGLGVLLVVKNWTFPVRIMVFLLCYLASFSNHFFWNYLGDLSIIGLSQVAKQVISFFLAYTPYLVLLIVCSVQARRDNTYSWTKAPIMMLR